MAHMTTIAVRWSELDPYNHVNHPTYLTYLEEARIKVLEDIGWDMAILERAGYRVVVVGVSVDFKQSATAGDTLTITSQLVRLGASASTWRQVIARGDDVIAEATIRAACTDLDGAPVRTPDGFKEALAGLLDSPEA